MKHAIYHRVDTVLHILLDDWINNKRPGWGALQLIQWHVCQAYEGTFT